MERTANKEEEGSTTQVLSEVPETSTSDQQEYVLHLQPQAEPPRVRWATDTVDNEDMGKKKSKCCCIYKKKRNWDSSDSSDSECETGHCRGHVEKHKKPDKNGDGDGAEPSHSKEPQ